MSVYGSDGPRREWLERRDTRPKEKTVKKYMAEIELVRDDMETEDLERILKRTLDRYLRVHRVHVYIPRSELEVK